MLFDRLDLQQGGVGRDFVDWDVAEHSASLELASDGAGRLEEPIASRSSLSAGALDLLMAQSQAGPCTHCGAGARPLRRSSRGEAWLLGALDSRLSDAGEVLPRLAEFCVTSS